LKARKFAAVLCLTPAMALAACGGDSGSSGGGGSSSSGGGGNTVDVYSSLPLQGASRDQTQAMVQGIQLALEQNNSKAGSMTIKYKSLDDSTAQAGAWTPETVQANARQVAQDKKAAFYIGEFNSGASAVSIPILNEAGIPQLSPANTAVGLTTNEPGADKGEPDKYYPAGTRTYARIVPKDTIQGAALATVMKEDGCTNVAIANDKEVYGAGLARNIVASAKKQGLKIAGNEGIDTKAPNYRSLAQRFAGQKADCFVFSGITANGAVQIYKDMASALPTAKLYGPDGVAESGFADPKKGGIPDKVGARVKLSVATLSPDEYPPEGQKFFTEFTKKYKAKNPDPYAIYGYEAMQLAIDAIKRSGDGSKEAVLKALFNTKDRQSVLGQYSIDKNGDTTLTDYGIYTVKSGELTFDKTIKAQPAS
jgi:branched-chain amino acid transport system substrate-binding protein